MKRGRTRRAAAMLAVAAGGGLVGALTAHAGSTSPWNWFQGDERAYVAGSSTADDLSVFALRDVNILGSHLRLGSKDGNFELEHDKSTPTTTLNAYFIGSPTRTPIAIGGTDAQDIVSLIVGSAAGQKSDIQQWLADGKVAVAVDGKGDLRLGTITLSLGLQAGKVVLVAELPDGSRQVLATGTPTRQTAATSKTATTAAPKTAGGH